MARELTELLSANPYPGRGILLGLSDDGANAIIAYFIMGRSENSRNRVFIETNDGIRTEAFDPDKLTDPSLIIYSPVRTLGNAHTIVTNGDQTDTIYTYMRNGGDFRDAIRARTFEPDAPNYTPRISGLMTVELGKASYSLDIIKSDCGDPDRVLRYYYDYQSPRAGEGRLIHTYTGDGSPLPSFEGEPTSVKLSGGIDDITRGIWGALNEDNRVSLFVRFIGLETGATYTRIMNKLERR